MTPSCPLLPPPAAPAVACAVSAAAFLYNAGGTCVIGA
jgi:hypothetical protein